MNISINDRHCEAIVGDRLLDVARSTHSHIGYFCGGNAICQTCYVKVLGGGDLLSPLSNAEKAMLSDSLIREGNRMACQTTIEKPGTISLLTMVEEAKRMTLSNPVEIPAYMGKMGWEAAVKFTDTIAFQAKREHEGHPIEPAALLHDVIGGIRDAFVLIIDAIQSALGLNRLVKSDAETVHENGCCCETRHAAPAKSCDNGHGRIVAPEVLKMHPVTTVTVN
jgi:chlorosome envelope protein X